MFEKIISGVGVGFFLMILTAIVSFFANIYQFAVGFLALTSVADTTPLLVVKGIGIVVPPLGSVMGFLGFFGV